MTRIVMLIVLVVLVLAAGCGPSYTTCRTPRTDDTACTGTI